MFLFTTPNSAPSSPPSQGPTASPVTEAIRRGAEQTGTSFDYLVATAKRESALDPSAKAPTSSASGLFQFIEQTWLGVVKSDGDKAGLGGYADQITARQDGTLTIGDPGTKQAVLKLREDPNVASVMAGALTRQNRDALVSATGREPSDGELYLAHVLGARGAGDLIRAAQQSPGRTAAIDFPDAAAANRSIFYDRSGRPRNAAEVYSVLAAGPPSGATTTALAPAVLSPRASPAGSEAGAPVEAYGTGSTSLFQTSRRAGPISDAVAKIWRTNNGSARVASAAAPFFPRTDTATSSEAAMTDPAPVDTRPVVANASGLGAPTANDATSGPVNAPAALDRSIPWPPPRPRFEAASGRRPGS